MMNASPDSTLYLLSYEIEYVSVVIPWCDGMPREANQTERCQFCGAVWSWWGYSWDDHRCPACAGRRRHLKDRPGQRFARPARGRPHHRLCERYRYGSRRWRDPLGTRNRRR